MAKEIYVGKFDSHINQRLVNLIINKQFPAWDLNNLHNFKRVYQISKTWLFFDFQSLIFHQFISFIEIKIYAFNN